MLALKAADVCANITDVVLDHREIGDDVWLRFRRGAAKQLWYYTTVAETVLHRLEGNEPLRTELRDAPGRAARAQPVKSFSSEIIAGPRTTTNIAGKMNTAVGNSILIGAFIARSSAAI